MAVTFTFPFPISPIANQLTSPQSPLKIPKLHLTLNPNPNPNPSPTASRRRTLSVSAKPTGSDPNGDGADGRPAVVVDLRRWGDLLRPDPENIVAVGLTGLLAWASVQALFQLLFISVAIILAAVKYSFIAALLLFIVITLL